MRARIIIQNITSLNLTKKILILNFILLKIAKKTERPDILRKLLFMNKLVLFNSSCWIMLKRMTVLKNNNYSTNLIIIM